MSPWEWVLIAVAGVGGGAVNAIVGSGTLITFPTLVALGVPPVAANVSNAVGLFPGSLAGAWAYRDELRGWRRRGALLIAGTVFGAVLGAVLLLAAPASAFQVVAPILIVIALSLVVFGRKLSALLSNRGHVQDQEMSATLWVLVMLIGIYGGYFGAAQGVLMMGVFGIMMSGSVQHHNGMKNLLSGVSKCVATIIFIIYAEIDWKIAGTIALGSIIGGLLGAHAGRRMSPKVLRSIIVLIGLVAVIKLIV